MRICSITGETMQAGFLFNDTVYIKYEKDALKYAQDNGYQTLEDSYNDGYHYWTEWGD